jgi:hypothetical protein
MSILEQPLPVPDPQYRQENEAYTRRALELALNRVENDINIAKTQGDKQGSLSMRRHQFLLMGAS